MTDTPQPATAGETVVAPVNPVQVAADAFKVSLGQAPDPRQRDEQGRFRAAEQEPAEQIEAPAGPVEGEDVAENPDDTQVNDEAAEEAQPAAVELPLSWAADKAELWSALPEDAQAYVRQRDGEIQSAVNTKFMEAANYVKGAQSVAQEASNARERALEATEIAIQMLPDPEVLLDSNSEYYNPDAYQSARDHRNQRYSQLVAQRQDLIAQGEQQETQAFQQRLQIINQQAAPALLRDVPDLTDQTKAGGILQGLIDYTVRSGAPPEIFNTPTSALEWHMIWKAQQYDRLQAAKAKVATDPKPEQRKAAPPVRPGVATPRSAIQQQRVQKDLGRLAKDGSIESGAAIWKHLVEGQK